MAGKSNVWRKMYEPLKGKCQEIFDFRLSTWISFPQAPDYTIRAVSNFFKICGNIRSSRCTTVLLTPVANGKNFQKEKFEFFFWTPLGSRVSI
jgi:hypothetical protein